MHTKVKQNRKRSPRITKNVSTRRRDTGPLHFKGDLSIAWMRKPRKPHELFPTDTAERPLSGTADTDPEPGDAIRTLLPDSPDFVVIENCIIADERYVFRLSLGDQHSIKWFPMRPRQ